MMPPPRSRWASASTLALSNVLRRHRHDATAVLAAYICDRRGLRFYGPRSVAPSALSRLDTSKSQLADLAGAQSTRTSSPLRARQRKP